METEKSSPKQRLSFIEAFRLGMTMPISDEARARVAARRVQPDEETEESLVIVRGAASSEPPA